MKAVLIDEFMTRSPICIDARATVIEAYRKMQATGCRHLPVLQDGKVVGIVSQRGLYRLETLVNVDRAADPVIDAMDVPFVVAPGTAILDVAEEMARRKAGACLVVEGGIVKGIFTTNDALIVLATILGPTAGTKKRAELHA